MKQYNIGIDCRLAGLRHAGIGRYVVELVTHLVQRTDVHWTLFFTDTAQAKELLPKKYPDHCKIIIAPVKHYTVREQLELPGIFAAEKLDLLHVPHFNVPVLYTGKMVITIHDLLWHEHRGGEVTTLPKWQYWVKYVFYRVVTTVAVNRAKKIFVPTKAVQQTLLHYYAATKSKIVVTPEAVGNELLELAHKKRTIKRHQKELLYVGSLYPHKNLPLVLTALARQLTDYSLVVVGSRSVFRMAVEQQVSDLNIAERVTFEGSLSDEVLAKHYQQATALVQPSFSEGFGLTGLEAMSFETPVVASNIPVFTEVYQKAALYFDPKSVSDFSAAVKKLENATVFEQLSKAATGVSKQYNWQTLADTTYSEYKSVIFS